MDNILLLSKVDKGFTGAKGAYRKELIRVGDYAHPGDGYEFSITRETLQHWADTFKLMKKNGVKVPMPSTHEGVGDPDKNRGYITSMSVEGDSLIATCDLIGEDALAAAMKSDVSIASPAEWTDGKGNKYLRPITHVALVTDPVIPGLENFIALVASARSHKEPNVEKYAELVKEFKLTEKITDDNVVELVLAHNKTQVDQLSQLKVKHADEIVKLKAKKPEPEPEKKLDPVLLSLAADNRTMKLDALVAAGKITPDVKKQLVVTFIGDDQKALALSLSHGADVFDQVIMAMAANDPVKLAETTRAQVLELSGTSENKDDGSLVKDAEARAKAAK